VLPVPRRLLTHIKESDEARVRRQAAQREAHLYMNIRVIQRKDVAAFRSYTFIKDFADNKECAVVRIKKKASFLTDFFEQVEKQLGVPTTEQNYWYGSKRYGREMEEKRDGNDGLAILCSSLCAQPAVRTCGVCECEYTPADVSHTHVLNTAYMSHVHSL